MSNPSFGDSRLNAIQRREDSKTSRIHEPCDRAIERVLHENRFILDALRAVGRAKSLHEAKSVALKALEEHGPIPPGYGEEIGPWTGPPDEVF